jgi:hypothetical protein
MAEWIVPRLGTSIKGDRVFEQVPVLSLVTTRSS